MDELSARLLTEPFRRTQLFAEASDDVIAKLAKATVRLSFKKNDYIVREGEEGDRMFMLIEGKARVIVGAAEDESMTLATLQPSDSFGELSLLDGLPRSATVQALDTPTVVFALSRDTFLEVLHSDSRLVEVLLKSFTATLKRLTEQTADIAFFDVRQRTARYLLHCCEVRTDSGSEVELVRKRVETELAALLGRTMDNVAEGLTSFQKTGAIKVEATRVIVVDQSLLRKVADGLL